MRWVGCLSLLLLGCSLELKGISPQNGVAGDSGEDDDPSPQMDAAFSADASSGDDGGGLDLDAARPEPDAGPDSEIEDAAMPKPEKGYQPPVGQVGSRCQTNADCTPLGLLAHCEKSKLLPYGSDTGYCTKLCNDSTGGNSCGVGAVCPEAGNNGGTCQRTCAQDSACRIEDGYRCAILLCWRK